jgi:hypothetical protein
LYPTTKQVRTTKISNRIQTVHRTVFNNHMTLTSV